MSAPGRQSSQPPLLPAPPWPGSGPSTRCFLSCCLTVGPQCLEAQADPQAHFSTRQQKVVGRGEDAWVPLPGAYRQAVPHFKSR